MSLLKSGDTVIVNAGAQKGITGRILSVNRKTGTAIVEGVNLKWKHVRRSQQNPQGGRTRREYPVDLSKLSFLDTGSGKGVRLGVKLEAGRRLRVMRPSGKLADA